MVDIESIRQLIEMMAEHEIIEITLRQGDEELSLKRGTGAAAAPPSPTPPSTASTPTMESRPVAPAPPPLETLDDLIIIPSPMVGTFYTCPSPGAPAFVNVGDTISPDTVVCIIEAMKVFNEIKAEIHGVVEKVFVPNEKPVEFGQPLFGVRRP